MRKHWTALNVIAGCGLLIVATALTTWSQTASSGASLETGVSSEQDPFAGMTLNTSGTVQYAPITINVGDLHELYQLTDPQLEVFLGELAATPQISTNALPDNGQGGTFYSLQNPNWPPLPGDIHGQPVWQMNGFYLLNDLNFDYTAAATEAATTASPMMATMGLASPAGGGTPMFDLTSGVPYLTIAPTGTNQVLITIVNPTSPENYELWWTPVLANPAYPWTAVAVGTTGQTNFTVNMGPYYTGFYRALQDTNSIPLWEAADPNNQATGVLNVWIDSPANGAVLQ